MGDVAKCPSCDAVLTMVGAGGAANSKLEIRETIYACDAGHIVRVEERRSFVG